MGDISRKTPYNGGNRFDIFELGTTTVFVTGTTGNGGNTSSGALFTFDRTEGSSIAGHPKKKSLVFTITSKINNEKLNSLFTSYLTSETAEDIVQDYEDGNKTTIKGVSASTPKFGFIDYGGVDADNKRQITYGVGVFSGDTGNMERAKNTLQGVPIEVSAIESLTTVIFPSSAFDSTLVSGGAAKTIAIGGFADKIFLTSL